MFSQLAALPNFHEIFPLEKVQKFWNDVEKSKDERLEKHPMKTHNWKKMTLPLWVHGDGVEYAARDSLMCWSWGPLMTNFNSVEAKFLLACYPKSCTAPETWNDIMKELTWSFNALVRGFHPTHDSSGKPLKQGSPFYEQKGQPLATGYKAVIWSVQGIQNSLQTTCFFPTGVLTFLAWSATAGRVMPSHPNGSKPLRWTSSHLQKSPTPKLQRGHPPSTPSSTKSLDWQQNL